MNIWILHLGEVRALCRPLQIWSYINVVQSMRPNLLTCHEITFSSLFVPVLLGFIFFVQVHAIVSMNAHANYSSPHMSTMPSTRRYVSLYTLDGAMNTWLLCFPRLVSTNLDIDKFKKPLINPRSYRKRGRAPKIGNTRFGTPLSTVNSHEYWTSKYRGLESTSNDFSLTDLYTVTEESCNLWCLRAFFGSEAPMLFDSVLAFYPSRKTLE